MHYKKYVSIPVHKTYELSMPVCTLMRMHYEYEIQLVCISVNMNCKKYALYKIEFNHDAVQVVYTTTKVIFSTTTNKYGLKNILALLEVCFN